MARNALVGTRIREMRLLAGIRQAELARMAGISAAYLNLIEHNRRQVGGALRETIAAALGVAPAALDEEAGAALIEDLRAAAGSDEEGPGLNPGLNPGQRPEVDRIEEMIGRFPGWAARLAALARRQRGLEAALARLSDRMAHDPFLSDALHEIISAVSAVRATAAILAETEDIEPAWRARFHANLHQDALRMSASAEALVGYLDGARAEGGAPTAPLEELEAWRAAAGYHFAALEAGADLEAAIAGAPELASGAAQRLARDWAARYAADARALPLATLRAALAAAGDDPLALAAATGADLALVLRRLAALPGASNTGLLICDGAGALVLRKPLDGFRPPRFGAGCPLWPLYAALARPMQPLVVTVETAARLPRRFAAVAIAQPRRPAGPDLPPLWEATMLLRPAPAPVTVPAPGGAAPAALRIGTTCRICPRADCPARREPALVRDLA